MTLADQWLKEGQEKGRQEGRRLTLQRQLRLKFGEELPTEVLRQLDSANDDQLDVWIERILSASSLDEVFRS